MLRASRANTSTSTSCWRTALTLRLDGRAMYASTSHNLSRRDTPCHTLMVAAPCPPPQANYKPLHHAAYYGRKLCVARLLVADDTVLTVKDGGETPADKARRGNHATIAAALDRWQAGDRAGVLEDLDCTLDDFAVRYSVMGVASSGCCCCCSYHHGCVCVRFGRQCSTRPSTLLVHRREQRTPPLRSTRPPLPSCARGVPPLVVLLEVQVVEQEQVQVVVLLVTLVVTVAQQTWPTVPSL